VTRPAYNRIWGEHSSPSQLATPTSTSIRPVISPPEVYPLCPLLDRPLRPASSYFETTELKSQLTNVQGHPSHPIRQSFLFKTFGSIPKPLSSSPHRTMLKRPASVGLIVFSRTRPLATEMLHKPCWSSEPLKPKTLLLRHQPLAFQTHREVTTDWTNLPWPRERSHLFMDESFRECSAEAQHPPSPYQQPCPNLLLTTNLEPIPEINISISIHQTRLTRPLSPLWMSITNLPTDPLIPLQNLCTQAPVIPKTKTIRHERRSITSVPLPISINGPRTERPQSLQQRIGRKV